MYHFQQIMRRLLLKRISILNCTVTAGGLNDPGAFCGNELKSFYCAVFDDGLCSGTNVLCEASQQGFSEMLFFVSP